MRFNRTNLINISFIIAFGTLKLVGQNSNWTNVGPIAFPNKTIWQVHGIGRCSELQFHASNPNKMYTASASGGLWKSEDKGKNWQNLGTDQITKVSSASLAIDPIDDRIIYWGTGDNNYYSSGYGVYKTLDEGKTWFPSNTGMGNTLVTEILIDPKNTQIILAATNDGIYKSTNGGALWSLKTNSGLRFQDMCYKANKGTSTIYACTKTAFFRSTNKGDTWQQITSGLTLDGEGARVAVSPADSNMVYVGVTKPYGAIFRSSNGGTSFVSRRVETAKNLVDYGPDDKGGGQGNYNFDIVVDPSNINNLFLCSHLVWGSTDGGANWTKIQQGWAGDLHTDQHQILYNPYVKDELWNVNDGGIWKNNTGGTGAWTPMSDGIAATEIYHGSASNVYREMIGIGTQDNGGFYYLDGIWFNNRGGDYGAEHQSDYNSNSLYHPNEGSRDVLIGSTSKDLKLPFTPDDNNKAFYAFSPASTSIGFVYNTGTNTVYRTSNLVSNSPVWSTLFTCPATIKDMKADAINANILYIIANDNKIYRLDNALSNGAYTVLNTPNTLSGKTILAPMASANGLYLVTGNTTYKSTNKGVNWSDISSGLPSGNVVQLASDIKSTTDAVYYCTSLGVYYYDNTRTTWLNYSQGLPIVCGINDMDVFNNGVVQGYVRVYFYGRGVWEKPVKQTSGAPYISLTSPANLSTYTTGSTITLKANANDIGGTITKVEFFNGNQSLGIDGAIVSAGPVNNTIGAGASHGGGQYLVFTAMKSFTLRSVKVYATGTKDRTITLKDVSGSLIDSKTVTIPDGESVVTLNLTIPAGVDMQLGADAGADLFRNSAGGVYPYTVPNLLSVTKNSAGAGNEAYYYYFYDWKVQSNEYSFVWNNVPDGNYTITAVATDNDSKTTKTEAITIGVGPNVCNATGSIGREQWDNVTGNDIIASVLNTIPSSISMLTIFEAPSEVGSDYQSRIRGYICPPLTGNYTFWISGDDNSELWLSTNNLPVNKKLICKVPGYSSPRGWDDNLEQKSLTIALQAGRNYYIEAIHKEGGGGDHLAVGWQVPNGTFERPIAGVRLSPFTGSDPNAVGTFYQNCNYGGYAIDLVQGNYTTAQLVANSIANNDISSIKVKSKFEVMLYDLDNFKGDSVLINSDNACLVANNFNDKASSLKVRKDAKLLGTVYQHCNYDPSGYDIDLYAGDYTSSQLLANGISNNDISSIMIKSGYEMVLFDGDNFTGDSIVKTANTSCLVDDNFNDVVSSLKIRKTRIITDIETISYVNVKTMVFPNPIEQYATVKYQLQNSSPVSIRLYNSKGQEVAELLNENKDQGTYELPFDASNLSDGIYILKVTTNKTNEAISVFVGKNRKPIKRK